MKSFPRHRWIYIGLALLIGLILFAAPQGNSRGTGSTYNRAPDGYGAWYAYMEEQGHPVQRWRKSSEAIAETDTPQTFLQIAPPATNVALRSPLSDWLEQGNTWIILGEEDLLEGGFPTNAPFTTTHRSEQRAVKVETTKRYDLSVENKKTILGDRFGAIIRQETVGKGRIIRAVSPFLGANAYQDESGNFAYLEALVTQFDAPIVIDEFIHGYRDQEDTNSETVGSWGSYLAQTPLLPLLIQTMVVMLVLIWAQNRRFGPSQKLQSQEPDNSEAYIQALAGVLEKADRSEFVLEVVGHETQLQLQRSLGLGRNQIDTEALTAAWVEQTGRPAEDLTQFLEMQRSSRLNRSDLLTWIQKLQDIQAAVKTKI